MNSLDVIAGTVLEVGELSSFELHTAPAPAPAGAGAAARPEHASDAWHAARARTDTARQAIQTANAWAEVAADLIHRALELRDDVVLGYDSWEAYVAVEFAGVKDLRLPAEGRRRIIAALDTAGVAGRKGAAPLGISEGTWRNDLAALAETGYVPYAVQQAALKALPPAKKGSPARTRVQRFLDLLEDAGEAGKTAKEMRKAMRDVPDPGAIASELHTRHVIARLAAHEQSGTREGYAVYVRHHHVGLRDVEAPGRRSRKAAPIG